MREAQRNHIVVEAYASRQFIAHIGVTSIGLRDGTAYT
jgi:hypothetical protein